jgi:hypothetical protein
MKHCFIFTFIALLVNTASGFGQTQSKGCVVKLVRLKFDKTTELKSKVINDSLLMLAVPTDTTLAGNSDIRKFEVKIDTLRADTAITNEGMFLITSHRIILTTDAASRLVRFQIPLCCGIPVALMLDGKEIYRAMLWNPVSSFGNKSITMTLIGDELVIVNQLPKVTDDRNSILKSKSALVNCLLGR